MTGPAVAVVSATTTRERSARVSTRRPASQVPLLRVLLGHQLRAHRRAQHRTLRDVATSARVSLGYLSEVERGQKEASSELLAAICTALELPLSQVLSEITAAVDAIERTSSVSVLSVEDARARDGVAAA